MRMWEARGNYQLILGSRTHRLDNWIRRAASAVLRRTIRFLFRVSLHDPNVPFRLYRNHTLRGYLAQLPQGFESVNLALAVLYKFHYPEEVCEQPIPHRFRSDGGAHRSFFTLAGLFLLFIQELTQLRFSLFRKQLLLPSKAATTI